MKKSTSINICEWFGLRGTSKIDVIGIIEGKYAQSSSNRSQRGGLL